MLRNSLSSGHLSLHFISVFEHLPSARHWGWEFSHEQVTPRPLSSWSLLSSVGGDKYRESKQVTDRSIPGRGHARSVLEGNRGVGGLRVCSALG